LLLQVLTLRRGPPYLKISKASSGRGHGITLVAITVALSPILVRVDQAGMWSGPILVSNPGSILASA